MDRDPKGWVERAREAVLKKRIVVACNRTIDELRDEVGLTPGEADFMIKEIRHTLVVDKSSAGLNQDALILKAIDKAEEIVRSTGTTNVDAQRLSEGFRVRLRRQLSSGK